MACILKMLLEALDNDETVVFTAAAGKHRKRPDKVASEATSHFKWESCYTR